MLPDLRLIEQNIYRFWNLISLEFRPKTRRNRQQIKQKLKLKGAKKKKMQNLGLETQRKVWFQSYVKTENGEQDDQIQMQPNRHRYYY